MSRSLLLAVDVGNTNVVFGLFDGDALVDQWRSATVLNRTADEYAVWLTQLLALDGIRPEDISAAIIANVVPQALYEIDTLCRRYFKCEPRIVGRDLDLGLRINIDRPGEVGADRLVDAVAAHNRYPGWLIVIDFGTATTLDVISEAGNYEGGVIAPGVNLSLEALDRAAAKLPRVSIEKPQSVIGTGTVSAMQSGIYWGYVGLLEGLIARIRSEVGQPLTCVATGGLAALFNDATEVIDIVDPDLTLHGLCRIHRLNQ